MRIYAGGRGNSARGPNLAMYFHRIHKPRTGFPQPWVWKSLACLTIWGLAAWIAIEVSK